jgi:hypothetical protein
MRALYNGFFKNPHLLDSGRFRALKGLAFDVVKDVFIDTANPLGIEFFYNGNSYLSASLALDDVVIASMESEGDSIGLSLWCQWQSYLDVALGSHIVSNREIAELIRERAVSLYGGLFSSIRKSLDQKLGAPDVDGFDSFLYYPKFKDFQEATRS